MNQLTPNPVDPFSRSMVELYDEREMQNVPTAFQSFFGNPANGGKTLFSPNSDAVDIDIIRGNEKIAALIPRGMVSRPLGSLQKNLQTQQWTSFSRKFPLSEEEGDINAGQLISRLAGEAAYDSRATDQSRLRILGRDIHMNSMRRSIRMFEVLCAQSILEGKMDAIIGTANTELQYNFKRNSDNIFSAPIGWNQTTAQIIGDIDDGCDILRINGQVAPDFCGLGGAAMSALINDPDVQTQADNRRFELIKVSNNLPVPAKFEKQIKGGWNARGLLRTPKGYEVWLFTNVDVYTDEAGDPQKYMPEDKCFITSVAQTRMDRYFGPRERMPFTAVDVANYQQWFGINPTVPQLPPKVKAAAGVIRPEMFYVDAYQTNDAKKISLRTQSAPIFVTTMTDGIVVIEDLIT